MAKQKEAIGFEKALRDISNRHSINQLFDDFLQMAVCAFSVGFMEEEYKKVADKYKPEELKGFSIALAELTNEYELAACDGGWDDIVGITFENVNSKMQASNSGQFFTPVHLCNLMAKITHDSTFIPDNVNDCACGSSRNLIAHCRLRPEHRIGTFYHAYDLDSRCVLMSVVNFIMYGMKGVVIHMNALTLEIFGGYRIYLPETGLFVKPMTIDQCKYYLFQKAEKTKEPEKIEVVNIPNPVGIATQLTLF